MITETINFQKKTIENINFPYFCRRLKKRINTLGVLKNTILTCQLLKKKK